MANQNTDKALLGYTISSNSILQKIEVIQAESTSIISKIEKISIASVSTMHGIAAAITNNTKVLVEIKELLQKRNEGSAKISGSVDMKSLMGAAGAIAIAALGIFSLSMAFQQTENVTPAQMIKGVAILATLIPMTAVIGKLVKEDGGGIFSTPKVMKNFVLTTIAIAGLTYLMAISLQRMPTINGNQLISLLAISTVIYLQGKIFIELIKAWEFKGFINKYLNKTNTDEIMKALVVMSANTVIIAIAMNLMPRVTMQHAASFVIASAAMIPLAAALVVARFAIPAMGNLTVPQLKMFGLSMLTMALVMIPIGMAAKLLGAIGLTATEVGNLAKLTAVMAPIAAIVGLFTAIINFQKEKAVSKRGGPGETLLKQDNSRKRNQKMDLKAIGIFALKTVAILGALALISVGMSYAGPYIEKGINAMATIDYSGLFKFIAIIGFATLIMGVTIGLVVSMIKGKNKSSSTSLNPFARQSSSSSVGALSIKDIILSAIIIPIIIGSIILAAWAFKRMPEIPLIGQEKDFINFTATAGLGILIFGTALGIIMKLISKNIGMNQMILLPFIIPIIALGILATAWIFQALPETYVSPDPLFVLNSGFALLIFGASVALITFLFKRFKTKDLIKGLIATVVISLAILAVSFLLQGLASISMTSPPDPMWVGAIAISILIFGVAFLGVGYLVSKVGATTVGYGLLGVIAIALTMLISGWILAGLVPVMPQLKTVAQGFVDIFMMPFNGIIDIFKRFKDEIGIENMQSLALGIVYLAGAWLVLSAALAGSAIGGMAGALAGVVGSIADGISKMFGGDKSLSPIDLLERLANIAPKVKTLAEPIQSVGNSIAKIALNANGVIKALTGITKFADTNQKNLTMAKDSVFSISNSYMRIANASKAMNVKAIEASTNMFKALTDLANAKGENAMTILADKLMKAVAELSIVVQNLEGAIDQQGGNTNSLSNAIGGAINSLTEKVIGAKEDVEKAAATATGAGDMKEVVTALQDIEDLLANGILVSPAANTSWPNN
jgi:hypothetical protein